MKKVGNFIKSFFVGLFKVIVFIVRFVLWVFFSIFFIFSSIVKFVDEKILTPIRLKLKPI